MADYPMLQAHRGVSTEYPENTMAAFKAAVAQGYDYIELDPNYTADHEIVVLHDSALNRTARMADGSILTEPVDITEITYKDALTYDVGISFSIKFTGERIPLLKDALQMAAEYSVKVKIDNKIERFSPTATEKLYSVLDEYESLIALTTGSVDTLRFYAERFPKAELHYDGPVNESVMASLSGYHDRLTVWLPYHSALTSWVTVPFADDALCRLVKEHAKLGIWIIKDYESYDAVCAAYVPDIVETTGRIKPDLNRGAFCDMHVHSHNSHDSRAPVAETAKEAIKRGVSVFAVTDHCDTQYYFSGEIPQRIAASVREARETAPQFAGQVDVLAGVEIGEMIWDEPHANELLHAHDYDVVIGSVHAVRYKEWSDPYSMLDFNAIPAKELRGYIDKYFDELLETLQKLPCDIMAHLTCPLRYINYKFGLNFDIRPYEDKITRVLEYIIRHGISMEINTSGMGGGNGYYMPDEWIVEKYRDMGGYLITLGSDAHASENISKAFSEAAAMLKRLGFKHYYYYKNRINIPCAL